MSGVNNYRMYVVFMLLMLISSCIDHSNSFKERCPYEFHLITAHQLEVPVTFTPHQVEYTLGDTLNINMSFSDSIKDISTLETFKIEGFPFKPRAVLYRFDEELNWEAGFRVNEYIIDSIYQPRNDPSSIYADDITSNIIHENNSYKYEIDLVLSKSGRYILFVSDVHSDNAASGNEDKNEQAEAITFEGKCPDLGYYICNIVQGDDQLHLFEEEMVALDQDVYRGKLVSRENVFGPLGEGWIQVEYTGFYGFEVKE